MREGHGRERLERAPAISDGKAKRGEAGICLANNIKAPPPAPGQITNPAPGQITKISSLGKTIDLRTEPLAVIS